MKPRILLIPLLAASFLTCFAEEPEVATKTRYARGATQAFARIEVKTNGNTISEQGVCYATTPDPTVNDTKVTEQLPANGDVKAGIYWLKNLTPSTSYYMRAFIVSGGKAYYGKTIHFYTLPKATISYTIRQDGDADAVKRITSAVKDAVDYWTNLTAMQGFTPNVGYNSGTPTADCSYGGWVRVGPNTSYQRTGTILHEFLHGVGVGTTDTWYNNADMRDNGVSRGHWLGDRATNIVRFLANSETALLNGDNQHLWPYGINGAHEDNGTTTLYTANSLVCEALGEDGLPLTSQMGFATPYYSIDITDTTKYYFKSESEDCGLYTGFLTTTKYGGLKWEKKTDAEAVANDSCAWYMTFNPVTCMYTIRNAATDAYILYNSGTFYAQKGKGQAAEAQLQLMPGRAAVAGNDHIRGYFILYNNHKMTAPCLAASEDGTTKTSSFTFSNSAKDRRWIILTKDSLNMLESLHLKALQAEALPVFDAMYKLRFIPHKENVSGINSKYLVGILNLKNGVSTTETAAELQEQINKGYELMYEYLSSVTATDKSKPFDLTFMLTNPEVTKTVGWSDNPTVNYDCAEYYEKTFDFYQTIAHQLPAGSYSLSVQAFQRPGRSADSYTAWTASADGDVSTRLYAGVHAAKVKNAWDDAQTTKVGTGSESAQSGKYIPNDMQSAAAYFDKGLYNDTLKFVFDAPVETLKVGLRCDKAESYYWSIFRNFRLYSYGVSNSASGVSIVKSTKGQMFDVYNVQGQLVRKHARDLKGLPKGIYVVNGVKIVL